MYDRWRITGRHSELVIAILFGALYLRWFVLLMKKLGIGLNFVTMLVSVLAVGFLYGLLVAVLGSPSQATPFPAQLEYSVIGALLFLHLIFDRMPRQRSSLDNFSVKPQAVAGFWRREGRARRPSTSGETYANLGARAAGTAQRLRQKWLAAKADQVPERLRWAEDNLPDACLFARAESALLRMANSSSNLFGYADVSWGREKEGQEAQEHVESLIELAAVYNAILDSLRSPQKSDIVDDLKELSDQLGALLLHTKRMYA